jgi:hypothetical protein
MAEGKIIGSFGSERIKAQKGGGNAHLRGVAERLARNFEGEFAAAKKREESKPTLTQVSRIIRTGRVPTKPRTYINQDSVRAIKSSKFLNSVHS